jgi:hypothetical protein
MKPILECLKVTPRAAVISATMTPQNKAQNEELAKTAPWRYMKRQNAGIEEERIVMQKPQETAAAAAVQARRVESASSGVRMEGSPKHEAAKRGTLKQQFSASFSRPGVGKSPPQYSVGYPPAIEASGSSGSLR